MGIEEISENVIHLGYLFFARNNNIKRTEKIEERHETNPIEPIAGSPAERGINKDYKETPWLGKYMDFYA